MPSRKRKRAPERLPVLADSHGPFTGLALRAGEGLVAVGGPLDADLLWHAYRHGVFPWFGERDPVLWWCPDPRAVLPLAELHVPDRLERTLRSGPWRVTEDTAFSAVMHGCAENRSDGTWITPEMLTAYTALHARGQAHSFEVWQGERLVGGLYGVRVGPIFCAESKFHRVRDASKVALVEACRRLAPRGVTTMDVQFLTPHLATFGVREIPRREYFALQSR